MDTQQNQNHDRLDRHYGLTETLRLCDSHQSLVNWQADTSVTNASHASAFELTVAMGRCLLFDFQPADEQLMTPLFPSMLEAATIGARQSVLAVYGWLESLDVDMGMGENSIEQHEYAIRILQRRLDLHASTLVIDQCIQHERQSGSELTNSLISRRDILEFTLDRLDDQIEREQDWLSVADQTYWVQNLAADLSVLSWPLHKRPWWLGPEIAHTRRFLQSVADEFAKVGDGLIPTTALLQNAVTLNLEENRNAIVEQPDFSLAADGNQTQPDRVLQTHRHEFSAEESIKIEFSSAAIDGLPDRFGTQTKIVVRVEVQTIPALVDVNADGIASRTYILRWGLFTMTIETSRRVGERDKQVYLLGNSEINWSAYRPLFTAGSPKIQIRRMK